MNDLPMAPSRALQIKSGIQVPSFFPEFPCNVSLSSKWQSLIKSTFLPLLWKSKLSIKYLPGKLTWLNTILSKSTFKLIFLIKWCSLIWGQFFLRHFNFLQLYIRISFNTLYCFKVFLSWEYWNCSQVWNKMIALIFGFWASKIMEWLK